MEGLIVNFRRSRTRTRGNQMIVKVPKVDSKEKAEKLANADVVFTTEAKNEIKGTVRSAHGNSGALRVLFEKGIPGQAIGQKVSIKA